MLEFMKTKKDETKSVERDIGFVQDVFGFCKDLVAFESHCIDQFTEDGKISSLKDLNWARKIRSYYMDMIVKSEGNNWCRSKHLLRVAMGLQEACSRFLSIGDLENAKRTAEYHGEAYIKFLEINGYNENDLQKGGSSA